MNVLVAKPTSAESVFFPALALSSYFALLVQCCGSTRLTVDLVDTGVSLLAVGRVYLRGPAVYDNPGNAFLS